MKTLLNIWAKIRPYGQKTKWFIVVRFPQLLTTSELLKLSPIDKGTIGWIKRKRKKITIIIPTFKDINLTRRCISTILKDSSRPGNLQIIIVDDGSPSAIQKKLLTLKSNGVEILLKEKNEGYSSAINFALNNIKKGDVVILNNDIECFNGWLTHLQAAAYKAQDVGITGPKLLYPNKTIQFAGGIRNTALPVWFDHLYRFRSQSFPPANIEREVLYITGACMYIKEGVIKSVGLFDKKFVMGFEDVDYCIRARKKGFKIIYTPNSILTHFESLTRGRDIKDSTIKSLRYFWKKWDKFLNKREVIKDKKLNIIYVLQDTGVGGGHRDVFEHINRLRKKGHSVKLYALAGQPKWFDLNVKVRKFKNYTALEKALENENALKIACWWETAESVWGSSLKRGIPVYFVQDIESSYYKDNMQQSSKVLSSYRKEFNYITISSWNKEQLKKLDISSSVISPGIDFEVFKQNNLIRRKNVILAIGRRLPLKNLQLTIEAWKKIIDKVEFWMFGIDPSIYYKLKSIYPDANIKYFLKPSDQEIVKLYNLATVFIQTSIHEGFCLPALEAMACGCPVITTESDGNMDFCKNKINCLTVGKKNPKELSEKILYLLNDPVVQEHLRKEGLKTAQKYAWDIKINELEDFYKKIAKKKLYSVDIDKYFSLNEI